MKKRVISLLLVIAFISAVIAPIQAFARYTYIDAATATLTISGGKAYCYGRVSHSASSAKVYVYLQKKSGSTWSNVASWDASGAKSLVSKEGSTSIASGNEYRVKVSMYVYNASGSCVESDTIYSVIKKT